MGDLGVRAGGKEGAVPRKVGGEDKGKKGDLDD